MDRRLPDPRGRRRLADTYELNRNLVLTSHQGRPTDLEAKLKVRSRVRGRFRRRAALLPDEPWRPGGEARRLVVRGFFAEPINQIGVPRWSSASWHVEARRPVTTELAGIHMSTLRVGPARLRRDRGSQRQLTAPAKSTRIMGLTAQVSPAIFALAGHPDYEITSGEAWLDDQLIADIGVDEPRLAVHSHAVPRQCPSPTSCAPPDR